MMHVRKVRMAMRQELMRMLVSMRLLPIPILVGMAVVHIVDMLVAMG